MKHKLEDYHICESSIPVYCDNIVVIFLSKNPILHSRVKHIEIKHHFIRDYVQKSLIDMQFIVIDNQCADIFTKPLVCGSVLLYQEEYEHAFYLRMMLASEGYHKV